MYNESMVSLVLRQYMRGKNVLLIQIGKLTGPTKELWRSKREANRGKFHFKNNGDHFFEKSRPITSQRAFQKTMAITLKVKFELFLACTISVHAGHFFFSI